MFFGTFSVKLATEVTAIITFLADESGQLSVDEFLSAVQQESCEFALRTLGVDLRMPEHYFRTLADVMEKDAQLQPPDLVAPGVVHISKRKYIFVFSRSSYCILFPRSSYCIMFSRSSYCILFSRSSNCILFFRSSYCK